jgi:hypothetical protein
VFNGEGAQSREGTVMRGCSVESVPNTEGASRSCQWIKGAVIRERVGERVPSGESDTQQRKVGVSSGSSGNSGSGGCCKANAATFCDINPKHNRRGGDEIYSQSLIHLENGMVPSPVEAVKFVGTHDIWHMTYGKVKTMIGVMETLAQRIHCSRIKLC